MNIRVFRVSGCRLNIRVFRVSGCRVEHQGFQGFGLWGFVCRVGACVCRVGAYAGAGCQVAEELSAKGVVLTHHPTTPLLITPSPH